MDDPSANAATSDTTVPTKPVCAAHPYALATFQCRACGKSFCETCRFNESDGQSYCTNCMVARMESKTPRVEVGDGLAQQMAEKSDVDLLAMLDVPEDWTPEAF